MGYLGSAGIHGKAFDRALVVDVKINALVLVVRAVDNQRDGLGELNAHSGAEQTVRGRGAGLAGELGAPRVGLGRRFARLGEVLGGGREGRAGCVVGRLGAFLDTMTRT